MSLPPIIIVTVLLASSAYGQLQLAVIAHPEVAQDTISKGQLLDYFTGDIQRWPDGKPVLVMDLGEKGETRNGFYRFLGKRPSRMKSIWLRKMLSGESEPPESLATEEEVLARVAQTPGALGFVRHSQVSDAVACCC